MNTLVVSKLKPLLKRNIFFLLALASTSSYAHCYVGCPPPPCDPCPCMESRPRPCYAPRPRPCYAPRPRCCRSYCPIRRHPHHCHRHYRRHCCPQIAIYNYAAPYESSFDNWTQSYERPCKTFDVIYARPGSDFIMNVSESPVWDMGTIDDDIY